MPVGSVDRITQARQADRRMIKPEFDTLTLHCVSEKRRESVSGCVGIAGKWVPNGFGAFEFNGYDCDSNHNGMTWLWAARGAIERTRPTAKRLRMRGDQRLINRLFNGNGKVYNGWAVERRALVAAIEDRYEIWDYVDIPSKGNMFTAADHLSRMHSGFHGKMISWPRGAMVYDMKKLAQEEELFG